MMSLWSRSVAVMGVAALVSAGLIAPRPVAQTTGACWGTYDASNPRGLICSGSCAAQGSTVPECKKVAKTDSHVSYKVCICKSTSGNGPETACCHTISRGSGANEQPEQKGTCALDAGCAGGSCEDINNDPDITDFACPGTAP